MKNILKKYLPLCLSLQLFALQGLADTRGLDISPHDRFWEYIDLVEIPWEEGHGEVLMPEDFDDFSLEALMEESRRPQEEGHMALAPLAIITLSASGVAALGACVYGNYARSDILARRASAGMEHEHEPDGFGTFVLSGMGAVLGIGGQLLNIGRFGHWKPTPTP